MLVVCSDIDDNYTSILWILFDIQKVFTGKTHFLLNPVIKNKVLNENKSITNY